MSFLVHRSGSGRPRRVVSSYIGGNGRLVSIIPGSASELAGIVGASTPAEWFSSFAESANGNGSVNLAPVSGQIAWVQTQKTALQAGNKKIGFASSHYYSSCSATFNKSFANATSFVFVVYMNHSGLEDGNSGASIRASANGYSIDIYPWRQNGLYIFSCACPGFSSYSYSYNPITSGRLIGVIMGWDARSGKNASSSSGTKNESAAFPLDTTWSSAGNLYLDGGSIYGNTNLCAIGGWSGAEAESLLDRLGTVGTAINSALNKDCRDHTVSSSISMVPGRYVTRSNEFARSADGLLIHPSVTNLITHSYSPAIWTASGLTQVGWQAICGAGVRTLMKLTETATTAEHKTSATFTPLATGSHVIHFEAKFGDGCEQIGIELFNGTDQVAMSLDLSGAQTPFATAPNVVISTVAFRHYSVAWTVDLTVLDVATLTAKGLELVTYNDDYLGVITKTFHIGNWCVVKGASPTVLPVSLGTTATAIAPIVDWSLASAVRRLASGRLTCEMIVNMGAWPAADVCLWSWRQNATNGVEVWLLYKGTVDSRRLFYPAIKAIVAGSSVTTELTAGDEWVMENVSTLARVETLRASVSIDSAGVAKWWFRSDAGAQILYYETDIFTSGQNTIASYGVPVPTSLRLGSSLAGTGQQAMTIKEVAVW